MKKLDALKYPGMYPVFFLGASAGGVQAFKQLARSLPDTFPAPLFFLLHRKIRQGQTAELLPEILKAVSSLKVVVPEEGDVIKAGHIYLPRSDRHLSVVDNRITFPMEPSDGVWRPSVDVLFKQAASEYQERAVCVLLTGMLEDGVSGLIETSRRGGITIVQSPEDAYAPSMPTKALERDHPSYAVSLENMPKLLCEMARFDYFDDQKAVCHQAAAMATMKKNSLKAS